MLCNVNMLLVFEDGYGNLVQFSRDKIKNIAGFFKDCKYNNVVEVSTKDVTRIISLLNSIVPRLLSRRSVQKA